MGSNSKAWQEEAVDFFKAPNPMEYASANDWKNVCVVVAICQLLVVIRKLNLDEARGMYFFNQQVPGLVRIVDETPLRK